MALGIFLVKNHRFISLCCDGRGYKGEPWLFQGQPIVLQRWKFGKALRKYSHTQVPVWIKLRHLPIEFWTPGGISTVANRGGRLLYSDAITKACTRLDFARVCVMLDFDSTLPKYLVVLVPRDDGSKTPCRVEVEYEWIPSKRLACRSLGHPTTGFHQQSGR
ncbi:UNVERIFIED_CONTAM: hypothetical protein Slati_2496200 [Sesamum latifolium]|uniref:DUF4283 domain-containing protein n=1 Tax=Sesamum latifolium TaxID=2727402 RepID=A0AAW2WI76_9LAMI